MRLVISSAPKNELCALYDSALSNTIRPYDLIILGKGAWYLNGEIIDNGITPPPSPRRYSKLASHLPRIVKRFNTQGLSEKGVGCPPPNVISLRIVADSAALFQHSWYAARTGW